MRSVKHICSEKADGVLISATPRCQSVAAYSLNGMLTYMSFHGNLQEQIGRLAAQRRIALLPPLLSSSPMLRELFVSADVWDGANPPWPRHRTGLRHIEFRAALDHFTQGYTINVAEDPFTKPRHAFMARVHPVQRQVWDIRCLGPDQGIRCFGCFAGKDRFVAITWDFRENITFESADSECREAWDALFSPLQPLTGTSLDEYLSNYVAV